jgi:hypothetical protein
VKEDDEVGHIKPLPVKEDVEIGQTNSGGKMM